MIVEKVLGDEVGVQWQGVQDKSEISQPDGLGVGVIVGVFKRGQFDKPFPVNANNVRARLGYDPTNLNYMAVQDALDTDAPVVWVLRLSGVGAPVDPVDPTDPTECKNDLITDMTIQQINAFDLNNKELYAVIKVIGSSSRPSNGMALSIYANEITTTIVDRIIQKLNGELAGLTIDIYEDVLTGNQFLRFSCPDSAIALFSAPEPERISFVDASFSIGRLQPAFSIPTIGHPFVLSEEFCEFGPPIIDGPV